ncbi:alpha/beta hydrolase [Paenibacillus anaericanus]|uniref:Alpha/beta hydrolase n=2 Tax=Paenibacillus TaxID=44249 RepID=A0A433Y4F0_9BACL|nr:alpha/beta hydrolase [Paenibacillus anaericanus]RUT43222.1 alpha/beta hydrolase [Paenibacillus anaericanus]
MSQTSQSHLSLKSEMNEATPSVISARHISIKHIVVAFLLSILFFLIFCFVSLHGYIAWVLSNPTVAPLYSNPKLSKDLEYQDVIFPAADGSRIMQGWYIPADQSKKTIIFSHGYGANREETWVPMYDLAHFAHSLNYNVLMFDYGFAAQNSKEVATGGKKEKEQLLGAIQLSKQLGAQELVIWGFSMGAGTALQAALTSQDIDGMILDSTFLLEPDTMYHNIRQNINLPRHPSLEIIGLLLPALNGTSFRQIPYSEVKSKDYPFPTLFIHGTEDEKAPYPIAEQLAENQTNPASGVWISEGAHHEMIFREHPKEYLRKVSNFLSNIELSSTD